ncbi:hypothetical protein TSMEX_007693, partial [Taenia solium]|eukprot:TsM_000660300 transcript=TsM_000660300 gene=TsM_000660300
MEKEMKEGREDEQSNRKGDGKEKSCKRKREDFLEIISKIAKQIYEQIAEFFEKWISNPAEEEQPNDRGDGEKLSVICGGKVKTQGNEDEKGIREGEKDELPGEKEEKVAKPSEGGEEKPNEMGGGKRPD